MDSASEETQHNATPAEGNLIMEKEISEDDSEIQEFFDGRSVFITGAGGFLGRVLLEQLLRLCPGISEIYILLREKRGDTPEKRVEKMLDEELFWKVKEDNPKALGKVHAVSGELTADGLGISPEDLQKVMANVSIVFHCAASISFRKDFRFMALNNVVGTDNVVNLCKKLPKIAALVFASTAYSNCHENVIKEEINQLPFPAKRITEAARADDGEFLTAFKKDYGKKWPNAYTLSKSVSENLIVEEAVDIPRAIVRPSTINFVWKGSLPGYAQIDASFSQIIIGAALGFLQVILVDEANNVDTVPADIVANTLIASAWSVAMQRIDSPLVLNCVSSNTVSLSVTKMMSELLDKKYDVLSPYSIRLPNVTTTTSTIIYRLLSFLYHHIPAYAVDTYTRLTGGKARAVQACRRLDQAMMDTKFFTLNKFWFKTSQFEGLKTLLSKKDQEVFGIDLSGYSFSYMAKRACVNKVFRFKDDDVRLKFKQLEFATKMGMYTQMYKCFLLLLFGFFIWYLVKLLSNILM